MASWGATIEKLRIRIAWTVLAAFAVCCLVVAWDYGLIGDRPKVLDRPPPPPGLVTLAHVGGIYIPIIAIIMKFTFGGDWNAPERPGGDSPGLRSFMNQYVTVIFAAAMFAPVAFYGFAPDLNVANGLAAAYLGVLETLLGVGFIKLYKTELRFTPPRTAVSPGSEPAATPAPD
jgi:hypothetical protein